MTNDAQESGDEAYFAVVAQDYDRLQSVVAGPAYDLGLDRAVDLIDREGADEFALVDLACGTAEAACRILRRFPRATAVCIDAEPAMLQVARTKLEPFAGRAEVRLADLSSCALPTCDVVVCAHAFHHLPPGAARLVLQRVRAALTPGGCFVLLDGMAVGPMWGERIGAQSRRLYRRHVEGAIAAGRATQDEVDARLTLKRRMKAEGRDTEYRHTADAILQQMAAAGFAELGIVWRMFSATIVVAHTAAT